MIAELLIVRYEAWPLFWNSIRPDMFHVDACFSSQDDTVIEYDARGLASL
jgi:hypothetical protein